MNTYIGMDEQERNLYEIASYVRLPCGRLDAFFKVLALCGYEIRRKDTSASAAHGGTK